MFKKYCLIYFWTVVVLFFEEFLSLNLPYLFNLSDLIFSTIKYRWVGIGLIPDCNIAMQWLLARRQLSLLLQVHPLGS